MVLDDSLDDNGRTPTRSWPIGKTYDKSGTGGVMQLAHPAALHGDAGMSPPMLGQRTHRRCRPIVVREAGATHVAAHDQRRC